MYDDPSSLVPLIPGRSDTTRGLLQGRLTAWDAGTGANTVEVLSQDRHNLPLLASAEATLAVPCTVLLIPFGPTYVIAGRIRVPAP